MGMAGGTPKFGQPEICPNLGAQDSDFDDLPFFSGADPNSTATRPQIRTRQIGPGPTPDKL